MNKELFVTSTPHETKVGLVEDDQLAEIYLEREGEYTLAGSIYKGRVTRVLPGMQSAFVDIGLERDAFLYVSDFLELEDAGDGDEETIPAHPMPADGEVGEEPGEIFVTEGSGEARPQRNGSGEPRRDRGYGGRSSRGGRRRGGRRDSGSRSNAGASTPMEPRDTEPSIPEVRPYEVEEVTEASLSDATKTIEFSDPRGADPHGSEFRSSESRRSDSGRGDSGRGDSAAETPGDRVRAFPDRGIRERFAFWGFWVAGVERFWFAGFGFQRLRIKGFWIKGFWIEGFQSAGCWGRGFRSASGIPAHRAAGRIAFEIPQPAGRNLPASNEDGRVHGALAPLPGRRA